MINIIENEPKKLSGLSSLFVSFKYNDAIITAIKNADKYAYDKSTYTWELPVSSLAYLLDELTYIDDITLQLKAEEEKIEIPKLVIEHDPPLFKHQVEAVEFGLQSNHKNWLLLDQPGLGKSLATIALAEELRVQQGIEHCLIICGINTLKANWKKEIKKFSNLSCRVIGEKINKKGRITYSSMKERCAEIKNPLDAFFYIVNVEMLRDNDFIEALKHSENKIDMAVVDELHKCGSSSGHQSQQTHNLLKLNYFKYKLGLTGTLLTNNPISAYSALSWLGVDKSSLTTFKSQYCVFGGFGGHQIIGYKNIDQLKQIIDSCSLRRTKDLLEIPPKTIITETLELENAHRNFYDSVRDGIKEECDKVILNNQNIMAMILRLRQATSCPSALTSESILSSKLQRAVDLAEDILAQGEKVVIMCTFKESVRELKKMLEKYKPVLGTGDIPDSEVSDNVDKFQTDPECKVFIGTYAKASTGITLNAATYMICIDQCWTYAQNEQAQDRVHRITNTKPVFIYYLICQDTVDEAVNKIVLDKKNLSDFIIDDTIDDSEMEQLRQIILDL